MLDKLQAVNPHLNIKSVSDPAFTKYGKVHIEFNCADILAQLATFPMPETGNYYVASEPLLEQTKSFSLFQTQMFGGLPIEIGYCNGYNASLNALEYHKCTELNVSTTDTVLFLGCFRDIKDDKYQISNLEAFYVPKEQLIELYGWTLHFSPCKVTAAGFKTMVALLSQTNDEFDERPVTEDKTLFKINKWLLCHPDNEILIAKGAHIGLCAPNLQINEVS